MVVSLTVVIWSAGRAQPQAVAPAAPAQSPGVPQPYPSPLQSPELTRALIESQAAQAEYFRQQAKPKTSGHSDSLAPTIIAALAGLFGSLGGIFFSTYLAEKRAKQEATGTYERHKLQLHLAVTDLREALAKIPAEPAHAPGFLAEDLIFKRPRRPQIANRTDPYYLKYDLVDSVYRLCALFGWLELYRTDVQFLRGSAKDKQKAIEDCFKHIRSCLSDATLAPVTDTDDVRDGFILDDDQRAIGERMLDRGRSQVIGYAAFCGDLFKQPIDRDDPTAVQDWWIWNATRFLVELNPPTGRTFARQRLEMLKAHLATLAGLVGRDE